MTVLLIKVRGGEPVVTTIAASETTTDSASLNARLGAMGDYPTLNVSFEWGATAGALDQETVIQATTSTDNFSAFLGDLDSGATYYFSAKVNCGTALYGDELSFTTEDEAAGWPFWIWIVIGVVVVVMIGIVTGYKVAHRKPGSTPPR